MPKSVLGTGITAINKRELPRSLHCSREDDDSQIM